MALVCASSLTAASFTAFGPEDFVRQTSTPDVSVRNFVASDLSAIYRLRIVNGGAAGQFSRVSSAAVTLNGTVVVWSHEFGHNVELIEKEVVLAAQNELTIRLRSAPGSGFTLTILGESQTPEVRIVEPAFGLVTASDEVDVSGTFGGPVTTVLVNGVEAVLDGNTFLAREVPLAEGTNRLVAIGSSASGQTASDSVLVRRDTSPPLVVIETPRNGERLIDDVITIAGTVNDIIPGATVNSDDVAVTVNGRAAEVNNRTFTLPDLPLALGSNTVTATAVDRAGNTASTSIRVSREPDLAGIRLAILDGNNQSGPILGLLPLPLRVQVLTEDGQPLVGRPLVFDVSKGDGLLGDPGQRLRQVTLLSDSQGTAAVDFTLGSRTGEGFHRIRVTTPGSLTFVELCASALPSAPAMIAITLQPPRRSLAGAPMADPLSVIVTDGGGNPVPGVPVTFRVERGGGSFAGQPSVVLTTDEDGTALARWTLGPDPGAANNEASATFVGNPGLPVFFIASGMASGPVAETRVSGVVQDSLKRPIPGVRAVIRGTSLEAFTGPDGRFTIHGVPPGEQRVAILGSTANDPGNGVFFPHIDFALQVISGADNQLDQLVVLPFLDMANAKVVGGDQDVVLGMDGNPGFAIKVFAHSVILPDGTRGEILMSSSQVKFDKVPMPPPRGATSFVVGTLQPGGILFDPPAQVSYPNVEGLAPGDVGDIYAFHHDIGQFVNVGPGTVSEDGSVVVSDPGFGIVESGWHCLIRIPGPTSSCTNNCSANWSWRITRNGSFSASNQPIVIFTDPDPAKAQDAEVTVTFAPPGGSVDADPVWTVQDPSIAEIVGTATNGSTVTIRAKSAGVTKLVSPRYRIPLPPEEGGDKTCQAEIPLTVAQVDLDAYKIKNNARDGELDDAEEEDPGAFVPRNTDDDDYDSANAQDRTQTGAITGESDLLPVILHAIVPASTGGKYTLTIPTGVRIWKMANRTDAVNASTEFDATADTTLYVEGITNGSGELKVNWKSGTMTRDSVDKVKVTVFEWTGPLNVPGFAIYRYTATGALATSQWTTPVGGAISTGAGTSDVTILWNGGPVVGQAVYQVNDRYLWNLEVNVVQIQISSTNNTASYPGGSRQLGANNRIFGTAPVGGTNAMTASFRVALIKGPTVGSSDRGVKFMEMGQVHQARFPTERSLFDNLTPPQKRVGTLENFASGSWLWDPAGAATLPWTFMDANHYLRPTTDTQIMNRDFSTFDAPTNLISDIVVFSGDTVDRSMLRMDHRLYFAVRTTVPNVNGSADVLTQRLVLDWHVIGEGTWNQTTGVWTYTGAGDGVDGDATWTEVTNGDTVPTPTNMTILNVLLNTPAHLNNWMPMNQ